ncbi:PepSY-associated TM region [Paracoccus halophilus]|uniref:PepSY-associated TM region n=1 Tax=Paracoccus halophilus TaxID=376733 RepID=A0A099EY76_9RHOB|nr:PepSY domain-containing protein [Paracoccus halophilus]KGJ03169.1 hypothetical protein IT41_15180 [Paracoccus halophilus]SFA59190.1 PepSY-associated TM region [Paracoccus halophilus]
MTEMTPCAASAALYRAMWRWHFIAGLVILPFVVILAITGAIYLFKDEINDAAHSRLRFVEPTSSQLTLTVLAAAVLDAHPGEVKAYTPPAAANRSAEVDILGEDGLKDTIFVNP